MELTGKNVFISGSSRGIGASMAVAFAKKGANVALNARKIVPSELLDELKQTGVQVEVILGDISQPADVKRMVKEAKAKFGQIDILVNNAGITDDKLLIGMKEADFTNVIDVNLMGTFRMTQAFLKQMYKKRQGVIINVASVVGLYGNVGQANYAASKAGIIGLTKTTAKEGALRNIRCNAIAPGMIASDMTAILSDKVKDQVKEQILLKRFGTPDEVAHAAIFLAENDYLTGQVLTVDGGLAF
ncbi:3-oxoacyl-[acyl-carrier-protein] reductase [Ligilactobacillus animalis]|uniref:3-oxoacyl-[acyl-carrier-protein] reductase n=1 Tax=Ligilactobacillus animalis TaxID=1605 RepID=A0ABR4RML4_9LACO|nr:3-oxoacyl-[acyl-carrier-protein] reductase [Ligilactobacillus animalis]KDA45292.1 3-oxoacyl-acyl-carrier-protein reductase, fabG [Ligilactobacillus animalis]MEE0261951.1 3-oxoacyl-[acyl-carrier-protein] reductase [Ligilactobacillus animalis]PNQ52513.1 3-oxoacyl-[acyl-carrier-protein] reductase [Ligilactobacillus animalis]